MSTRIPYYILLLVTALIFLNDGTDAGIDPRAPYVDSLRPSAPAQQRSDQSTERVNRIFDAIEAAILAGDVKKLSPYFGRQVNLNLQSATSGYYSGNQSYYILQNYFSSKKILSFKFTSRKPDDPVPFATGGATARIRGTNELLQFYVSLVEADGRWVISQFNVY